MKKTFCFLLILSTFCVNYNYGQDTQDEGIKERAFLWEVSRPDIYTTHTNMSVNGNWEKIEGQFQKMNENLLMKVADMMLNFDKIAGRFEENSKFLEIDNMNIKLSVNAKGQVYVVSGGAKGVYLCNSKKEEIKASNDALHLTQNAERFGR